MVPQFALHFDVCPSDGLAVAIDIDHAVSCADEDGNGALSAALRAPVEFAIGKRLEH